MLGKKEIKNRRKVTYYLQTVGAAVVHPDHEEVIVLPPEIIRKQDGQTKMDCIVSLGFNLDITRGMKIVFGSLLSSDRERLVNVIRHLISIPAWSIRYAEKVDIDCARALVRNLLNGLVPGDVGFAPQGKVSEDDSFRIYNLADFFVYYVGKVL
jgi:hypothetical protein